MTPCSAAMRVLTQLGGVGSEDIDVDSTHRNMALALRNRGNDADSLRSTASSKNNDNNNKLDLVRHRTGALLRPQQKQQEEQQQQVAIRSALEHRPSLFAVGNH